MNQDSLCYNIFTGKLPEQLQLGKIKEILSERLRKLPMRDVFKKPYSGIVQIKPEKTAPTKITFHKTGRKRFMNLQTRLTRRIKSHPLVISLLF